MNTDRDEEDEVYEEQRFESHFCEVLVAWFSRLRICSVDMDEDALEDIFECFWQRRLVPRSTVKRLPFFPSARQVRVMSACVRVETMHMHSLFPISLMIDITDRITTSTGYVPLMISLMHGICNNKFALSLEFQVTTSSA
jgi:hypothetical protein